MVAVREGHAFRGPCLSPSVFFLSQSPQTEAPQSRCGLNTMRQMQWVWCHCFLRGVGTWSVLERSNYSACIYFEKHSGVIIYSALKHILERILEHDNSHVSLGYFSVTVLKIIAVFWGVLWENNYYIWKMWQFQIQGPVKLGRFTFSPRFSLSVSFLCRSAWVYYINFSFFFVFLATSLRPGSSMG